MRLKLNILLITLLTLLSCAKEGGERGSDDQGMGTLHVRFDIPANAGVTKVDGGSGSGYDGTHNVLEKDKDKDKDNIIRHGRLFLVDKGGSVVAYRKASGNANAIGNSSAKEVITNIKRGEYKLYVVVNGSTKQAEEFDKTYSNTQDVSNLNINALLSAKLSENDLVGGNSPTFAETEGIPCTFVTDVAITAGNNYVDAHLERCVGRLTIKVLNNIPDRKLAIRSIGLSADNPTAGYYFPSTAAVTKVNFPELTETIVFDPNQNKTIFDHYVYETDVLSEGLTFDLFGAVYGTTATIGTDFRYSYDISDNIVNTPDYPKNDSLYFLRSAASTNYYIGDLDGTLGCREFSDDEELKNSKDIKRFLWKAIVSSSSTVAFQNVETEKYITLGDNSIGLGNTQIDFTFRRNDEGYSFYRQIPYYFWYYNYYLKYIPSNHSLSSAQGDSDKNSKWILRQATGNGSKEDYFVDSEAEISRKERRQIKIVDTYGDAQPLRQIKRNEHVTVSINIFYNRELGQFDFKVSSWKEISNTTTFD